MEDVASVELKFEVPPVTATQPATPGVPIDVGTAAPTIRSIVRPGATAPDFTVTTIDGQTWKYADHRGKPLVLVCWGTYGGNNERIAAFGDFARKWAKDPRLNVLGCVSTDDPAEAKKRAAELKLDFPHTADQSLMTKFGNSWPGAVVVSADGIILQKHLHDRLLEKYVNKALGGTTSAPVSR